MGKDSPAIDSQVLQDNGFLASVLDSVSDGICVLNLDLTIKYANKTLQEWCKVNAPIEGKKCFEVINNRTTPCENCPVIRCIKSGNFEKEIVPRIPGSPLEFIELSAYPIKNSDTGEITGVVEIIHDVTKQKQAEEALKISEKRFHELFQNSAVSIMIHDSNTFDIIDANKRALDCYGIKDVSEFKKYNLWGEAPYSFAEVKLCCEKVLKEGPQRFEWKSYNINREVFWEDVFIYELSSEGDSLIVSISIDITDRKKTEEALRESEDRFRSFAMSSTDAIIIADKSGKIVFWNSAAEKITGYSVSEFSDFTLDHLRPLQYREDHRDNVRKFIKYGQSQYLNKAVEGTIVKKCGEEIPVDVLTISWEKDGGLFFGAFIRDITKRKEMEEKLKKSIVEKDALMLEIHHRVKNNLAIVSSLIDLQLMKTEDNSPLQMLESVQKHIKAMGIVHNIIYESNDLRFVDMKVFIMQLVEMYHKTFTVLPSIDSKVENVKLGIEQAVPAAMIINELFHNVLKHAFPQKRLDETVKFEFSQDNDSCIFVIADNGVGFPEHVDIQNPQTMGLQILNILIQQLKGSIKIDRSMGTKIMVEFPKQ